jgi:hypothetical protein
MLVFVSELPTFFMRCVTTPTPRPSWRNCYTTCRQTILILYSIRETQTDIGDIHTCNSCSALIGVHEMHGRMYLFFSRLEKKDEKGIITCTCNIHKCTYMYDHISLTPSLRPCRHYGLVTSACSLLEELAHINSLGFSECVSPAVTRLSRRVR